MDSPDHSWIRRSSSNVEEERLLVSISPPYQPYRQTTPSKYSNSWVGEPSASQSDLEETISLNTPRSLDSRQIYSQHNVLPQHALSQAHPIPSRFPRFHERINVLAQSAPFWLALYFCFNLGLTLYNKIVLVKFPFPYTLTAMHTLFGSFGCYILQEKGYFVRFVILWFF